MSLSYRKWYDTYTNRSNEFHFNPRKLTLVNIQIISWTHQLWYRWKYMPLHWNWFYLQRKKFWFRKFQSTIHYTLHTWHPDMLNLIVIYVWFHLNEVQSQSINLFRYENWLATPPMGTKLKLNYLLLFHWSVVVIYPIFHLSNKSRESVISE